MTKKYSLAIGIVILVAIIVLVGLMKFSNIFSPSKPDATGLTDIRIGWQVPWAVQGQLTQILKRTTLLNDNMLKGEFKGFSAGGPLNEAALAGDVDLIFTADQPAATLLAKNPDWVIIGRLMYNRVSLYVPPQSPIKSVADLKGKTVAMPFGAAAQRMTLQAEEAAGLDPEKDVKNINLGIYEQSDLVRDANAQTWGDIDALAGFDPTPAIFEDKGLVRNLQVGKVVSVIMMSKKFIEQHPQAPENFLRAFYDAYNFYRLQPGQANQWFIEESKLDITQNALSIAATFEPNLQPDAAIRIDFTDDDYRLLQEAADFIYDQGLVTQRVDMQSHVDSSHVRRIMN